MRKLFVIILLFILAGAVYAQTSSEVSEADAAKLRKEYSQLKERMDSIGRELDVCRSNYDSDPEKYGSMIVRLEALMYDVSQKHALLSRRLEQIPEAKASEIPAEETSFKGRNLSDSPFVRSNVSKQDLALFRQSASIYSSIANAKKDIDEKYGQLQSMKERFDKTDSQQEVDRMILESESLKKSIEESDAQINDTWGRYYNAHLDNYLVMLDKLGNISRSKLESLDLLSRKAQSSVDPDETLAPALADISAQNQLILAYEELLAERLGYAMALDSIRKEIDRFSNSEVILYPDITFPYRTTCVYDVPTLGNSYSYSTPDEIPEVKVPAEGVYYSIQLYMSQTPVKQLSTFKGAQPLQISKSGSYYRYLAGGFRTYAEALKSLSVMQKSFKAPRIVAWLNGTITTNDKAKQMESQSMAGSYSIQIKSSKPNTSTVIKEVIEIHASGKTWTSSDLPTGGKLYKIMPFSGKDEAAVVAQIIKTKDSSAEVEVVEN